MKTSERISLNKRRLSDGSYSLYLDWRSNGQRHRESLKLFLLPEKTITVKHKNSETLRLAHAIKNKRILELQSKEAGIKIHKPSNITFSDFTQKRISLLKNHNTISQYKTLAERVNEFRPGSRVIDIDRDFYSGFIEYLEKYGYATNTIISRLTQLKATLHQAALDGVIAITPDFTGLTPKPIESIRQYLTLDEIRFLINVPAKNEATKQAFLFACFTGLRLSDIYNLKWSDIENDIITLRQKKTQTAVRIPISKNAKKFMPNRGEKDTVFKMPKSSSQVDMIIKHWIKSSGIKKKISFHCSRHTCATLTLEAGADLFTVSKILGHTKITTTQIYAKVLDEGRKKAVDLVPEI